MDNSKQKNNPTNIALPKKIIKKNDRIFLHKECDESAEVKKSDTVI